MLSKKYNIYDISAKQKIIQAIELATKAHAGQTRYSGEPYITHPLAVADILVDMGMDCDTIIAAVLHDVLEDTSMSESDIKIKFGLTVLRLVQGVTKLENIHFSSKEQEQSENFRKMFLAMASDVRVILIKLADRLHNMRTVSSLPTLDRRLRMAQETIEIYAPLASRLGISHIKTELEDLYLKTAKPQEFATLKRNFASKISSRKEIVSSIVAEIERLLSQHNIDGEVNGRPKHFYSIYNKMISQHKEFDQIFDLTAIRVIVNDVKDCYSVLGYVHHAWTPIPGRFKDYINLPKANNYQSLHTTVMTEYGMPFEIQIRTIHMHKIAEYGIAAHWKYKENINTNIDDKIGVLRQVVEANSDTQSSTEFFESFKKDFFADRIFVFTPSGDVVELPQGSTPVDFAYSVHSAVGNKCVGAKINGKIVQLDAVLNTGDYVEIITQTNSKGPSRDWLRFVRSSQAKSKIRSFFKREMKEENIAKGKEMLELECRGRGIAWSNICTPKNIDNVMTRQGINNLEDLYANVGYGGLTPTQIVTRLQDLLREETKVIEPKIAKSITKQPKGDTILIRGQSDLLLTIAKCCKPVPGDDIVGFISRGKGVAVHRTNCSNLKGVEQYRLIEAEWNNNEGGFVANIQVEAKNSDSLVVKLSTIVSENKLTIRHINLRQHKDNAIVQLGVQVTDVSQAVNIIAKIESLKEVYTVYRV